jgi:hypothetical protein
MDETLRLKIKVGIHEFEAEGPAAVVNEQFQTWKELVVYSPVGDPPYAPLNPPATEIPATIQSPRPSDGASVDAQLPKIMNVDGRVISLTVRAKKVDDAVLLILYGQKVLRDNDAITGGEVMEGLTATGGTSVDRVDRLLEKLGRDGDAIVIGERRAKRYRLTNAGITKARQLASELIAIVA